MLRSFRKVFAIMDAFTQEEPEWSLADLSRRLKLAKPTLHHIMVTLMEGGWIDRDPASKRYRLGLRLWEKGWLAINRMGVRDVARPLMERLVDECGETARLGILDEVDPRWVLYVDRVESQHAVRADSGAAMRAPSYCVATGKAMLAHNPEVLKRLLGQPLRGYTNGTLVNNTALVRDLALTRERGYSLNQSEFRADVVGIAAPVRNHEGKVIAGIGISGPAYRLAPAAVRRIGPVVAATAREISRCLGYAQQGVANETLLESRRRRGPVAGRGRRGGAALSVQADRGGRGLRARGRQ